MCFSKMLKLLSFADLIICELMSQLHMISSEADNQLNLVYSNIVINSIIV